MSIWTARVLLVLAIATQIAYLMLHYREASLDVAFWFGVSTTLAFSALMVFGGRTLAGLLRIGLGLIFLTAAFESVQSCTNAGKLESICAPLMRAIGPLAHTHAGLPAVPTAQLSTAVTVTEIVLGVLLLVGLASRVPSWLAAMFLLAYGLIAATSGDVSLVLRDAMPVLCTGSLLLSVIGPSSLGLDRARRRARHQDPFLDAFDEMRERGVRAWAARSPAERPLARRGSVS
ncbi:MAG: DoxX family membrane protein [Candidatus Eremiobacteraeota bacterium]|nr:DoxX family membrane protein [Candidatus Eremiobacteraeota bacterium]MBV8594842.1 DoxX family membrane protein [Candidatus Eremiobacteraeota bacterium]